MLDKFCRPTTILAANTHLLSVAEIASVTYRARKCVGMRFVNPVDEMKRLEIVRTPETDDETLAAVMEVAERMCLEVAVIDEAHPFADARSGITTSY
jgi:3-hydroxyacyl-CoA dehydrogenase